MKAMLFAAGIGSRLRPLTDRLPKCLVPVGTKTLLEHNLDFLRRHGVDSVVINVHHLADQVMAFLDQHPFDMEIIISREDVLLETGGGLLKAADHFTGESSFVVCNSDVYTDLNLSAMLDAHHQSEVLATLAVADRSTSRYLQFDSAGLLCGWENRKTGEVRQWRHVPVVQPLAFNGYQILSPAVFSYMEGLGSRFSSIEVYLKAAQAGESLKAFRMDDAFWIDIGTPEKLDYLRKYLA